ncbi:hypothetical protein HZA39_03855 [Candidatus Peregrinibacteria bacterium]|nr:hypothetical protein [Candidatus Peregrinibacteria bacterium]
MENTEQNNVKTETKTSDKILHERFTEYGANAREWIEKCKMLLPEIAKRRIWEKRGFSSIYEYAAKLAGMSKDSVDNALWILRKAEGKPELKKIAEIKGINSIRPVLTIATVETAGFWAEKVREMSVHTLETYVKEFKKADSFCNVSKNYYQNQNLFPEIKTETIQMEINPATADELKKLKGSGDWDELMQKFIELYKEKLEAQKPETTQSDSRHVPIKIERYVLARTNSTCAFPGCTKPYEILHHTARFSLTHEHNPGSLVPLCKAHERLAHLGLIENEELAPNEWRVRGVADKNSEKYKIDKLVARYRAAPG